MRALQRSGLTAEERQSLLLKASNEYMRGQMTRRQFQEVERKYGTDYDSVTLELASKHQLIPRLFRFLLSPFRRNDEVG